MGDADWRAELDARLAPFLAVLGHRKRRSWAPAYLRGLLGPGERKSLQPMAAGLGLKGHDQLQHFVASPAWDDAPLRRLLVEQADALVGGPDAVPVVDDTALPKKGERSVGVARQYCGCLGKRAGCQVLVSLTLAGGEVPLPLGLRLFLPEEWTADPERCARAGVPEEHRRALTKPDLALAEVDRIIAAGVRFGRVLADAGYGAGAAFRRGLSMRRLAWAVGILKTQNVYPAAVELLWPVAARGSAAQAPRAERGPRRGRGHAGGRGVAPDQLAAGHQRAARGRVRRPAGPPGGGCAAPQRAAPARGRGLAGRRAPRLGRAQVLPLQPARGGLARGAGGHDQGALGVRAGAPAAQGGARPRPLRGPLLDRPAPARADGHDRVRVPPAPAARGAGKKAAPARFPDRRLSRPCPRCGACSSTVSGVPRPAASDAAARSTRPCPVKCPGS